jgi:hypothetical protein
MRAVASYMSLIQYLKPHFMLMEQVRQLFLVGQCYQLLQ